jgi:hypothetical protein
MPPANTRELQLRGALSFQYSNDQRQVSQQATDNRAEHVGAEGRGGVERFSAGKSVRTS